MRPIVSDSIDTTATGRSAYRVVDRNSSHQQDLHDGRSRTHQGRESSDQEHIAPKRRRLNGQYDDLSAGNNVQSSQCHEKPWSVAEHCAFAGAIYNIGLKHSSPAALRENMLPTTPPDVTLERIKSHLQKYRAKAERREEFFRSYNDWMSNAMSLVDSKQQGQDRQEGLKFVALPVNMTRPDILSSGAMAAHLGFSIMMEETASGPVVDQHHSEPLASLANTEIQSYLNERLVHFPILSDEEKRSSLGSSMCLVMALFTSLTEQVLEARRKRSVDLNNSSIQNQNRGTNDSAAFPRESWPNPQKVTRAESNHAAFPEAPELPIPASINEQWARPPPHRSMNRSEADYGFATGQASMQSVPPRHSIAPLQMPIPLDDSSDVVNFDVYGHAFQPPQAPTGGYYAMRIGGIQSRQEVWEEDDDDYSFFRNER